MQDAATLKVVTLNLAHGRRDAWRQALLKRATIRANLDEIVRILIHQQPDVVALQEADAQSLWRAGSITSSTCRKNGGSVISCSASTCGG